MITPARITLSIALACALIGCKSGGGSSSDSGLSLSGQLSIPVNTVTDSDVNDSLATYASNNDPSTPQSIPNRVTVHGFASAVPI